LLRARIELNLTTECFLLVAQALLFAPEALNFMAKLVIFGSVDYG